jgi:hypothetical protein
MAGTLTASIPIMVASSTAWADPTDQDKAVALKLFDEGRSLLAAGKVAEACPKLEESRRLDPLPGTLLNLAVCDEQAGRAASAVAQFREARALAQRDHRDDRVALIDQHLSALEGKVSGLVIVVGPDADVPGLTVTFDGSPLGRPVWGTRIPIDPGEHAIEASAPNKKAWKGVAKVGPGGDVQTVKVSPLEDAPLTPAPPPEPPSATMAAAPAPPPSPPPATSQTSGISARKRLALVSAGVGLVGIGVGSYFGALAISDHSKATCTSYPCDDSLNNQSGTAADISTTTFAVGLVAVGLAAFLWLGDSSGSSDKPAVSVLPSFGPGVGGVDVSGRF